MLGLDTVESVAHVIQVALTPVFLLSGIASLLSVLSTRLARVADRVDALAEQLEADGPIDRSKLRRKLAYLRRRSHVLDAAVMMGTLGGVATSCAALLLFVGTLRDRPGVSLFVAFGLALLLGSQQTMTRAQRSRMIAIAEVRSCSDWRKCRPNAAQTPKQKIHWPTIKGPSPKPAENNSRRPLETRPMVSALRALGRVSEVLLPVLTCIATSVMVRNEAAVPHDEPPRES
jgi:hypothetical protein